MTGGSLKTVTIKNLFPNFKSARSAELLSKKLTLILDEIFLAGAETSFARRASRFVGRTLWHFASFLVADKYFYRRSCPSVSPSFHRSNDEHGCFKSGKPSIDNNKWRWSSRMWCTSVPPRHLFFFSLSRKSRKRPEARKTDHHQRVIATVAIDVSQH